MAQLKTDALVKQMLSAAGKVLKKDWPEARKYAELEFTKLAQTMAMIQTQHALGELNKTEARLLMDIQRHAARAVPLWPQLEAIPLAGLPLRIEVLLGS